MAVELRSSFTDHLNGVADSYLRGHQWGSPTPLPALPAVASFESELLPGKLRPFAIDVSERLCAPIDFVATALMVAAGSTVGRKVGMRPRQYHDWIVVPNIWGLVIGRSGFSKSPACSEALKGLRRLQSQAMEQHAQDMAEFKQGEQIQELRAKARKKQAADCLKKNPDADLSGLLADSHDEPPAQRRFIVQDSTTEALAILLQDNPDGLLVDRDEIRGLLSSLDKEDKAGDRAFYLTAADGDKSYRVDRVMRGQHHFIEALCLSLLGGIQPGPLRDYVRQATGGGSGADGFLQRFGLMVYPERVPFKDIDRSPNTVARQKMHDTFERLLNLTPDSVEAQKHEHDAIAWLGFNTESQVRFTEWLIALKNRVQVSDEHPAFLSWLDKLPKTIAAIALICHLTDDGSGPVPLEQTIRALAWGDYLESHARRVFFGALHPAAERAGLLLQRLPRLLNNFTGRDVYLKGWTGLADADSVRQAADVLIDAGYLWATQTADGRPGRPTVTYEKHPDFCTVAKL